MNGYSASFHHCDKDIWVGMVLLCLHSPPTIRNALFLPMCNSLLFFPITRRPGWVFYVKNSEMFISLSSNLCFWLLCPIGNKNHTSLEPILQSSRLRCRDYLEPTKQTTKSSYVESQFSVVSTLRGLGGVPPHASALCPMKLWYRFEVFPVVDTRGLGPKLLNNRLRQVPAV